MRNVKAESQQGIPYSEQQYVFLGFWSLWLQVSATPFVSLSHPALCVPDSVYDVQVAEESVSKQDWKESSDESSGKPSAHIVDAERLASYPGDMVRHQCVLNHRALVESHIKLWHFCQF